MVTETKIGEAKGFYKLRTLPYLSVTVNSIMPLVVTKERKDECISVVYCHKTYSAKFIQSDVR
jgi:hypothetical protein